MYTGNAEANVDSTAEGAEKGNEEIQGGTGVLLGFAAFKLNGVEEIENGNQASNLF